ncbi:MAG: fumarylacetoacetate hydrolase family protein, partial [Planctomycetota bacterium]
MSTKIARFLASPTDTQPRIGVVDDAVRPTKLVNLLTQQSDSFRCLADIMAADNPVAAVAEIPRGDAFAVTDVTFLPPVEAMQEVWAAGVTYKRSQTARMEESEAAASCYDRVYVADRPELFFKSPGYRTLGHNDVLRIRSDSQWNVPEPEVTLAISPAGKIVGYTIGNDMSSRDIEGENPLYLPQAKCYDGSAGVGPWIQLVDEMPDPESIKILLGIERDGNNVFDQSTDAGQMARGFVDLADWLCREMSFPHGVFLMTGTGLVPDSSFTLHPGDTVHITINDI